MKSRKFIFDSKFEFLLHLIFILNEKRKSFKRFKIFKSQRNLCVLFKNLYYNSKYYIHIEQKKIDEKLKTKIIRNLTFEEKK
jgi:hypothetical protein